MRIVRDKYASLDGLAQSRKRIVHLVDNLFADKPSRDASLGVVPVHQSRRLGNRAIVNYPPLVNQSKHGFPSEPLRHFVRKPQRNTQQRFREKLLNADGFHYAIGDANVPEDPRRTHLRTTLATERPNCHPSG